MSDHTKTASHVRQVLTAGGFPADVFAEGEAARNIRRFLETGPEMLHNVVSLATRR